MTTDAERISISIGLEAQFDLALADVWPDGDAPERPTAQDVLAVMRRSSTMRQWLHDWGFDDELEAFVMVTVPPEEPPFQTEMGAAPEPRPQEETRATISSYNWYRR